MLERTKVRWLYIVSALFIALNAYLLVREQYWLLLLPVAVIILFTYFYSLEKILLLVAFLTPLAINLTDTEFGVGVSLPTEPLMFGVLLIFIAKLFYDHHFDPKLLRHPVTIFLGLQLGWMFLTSLTSELPVVSLKALLARLWFMVSFYFLGVLMFKNVKNIRRFVWLYTIPLLVVIAYTIINHSKWGFSEQAGHWVMEPFYNDHTAYGAILALFIPVFVGFSFSKAYSRTLRFFSFLVLSILIVALVLSFSRAAWVSLAFSFMMYFIILFRIKFKWILLTITIFASVFFLFQNEIWDRLSKNKQDSSANFIEHLQSISNISTDDSNLERINRWQSAIRMFRDRPFFGFGPATYQFEYAPYQHYNEKTLISTNAGDKGNAHSEYIGPLAEEGVLGLVFVLCVFITIILTALKVHRQAKSAEVKMLSLAILLGLVTYFIHGLMNDFLDTDKASVPFWGFVGILVALDIYFLSKPGEENAGTR